jgi:ABC-2 type transport system permease protein
MNGLIRAEAIKLRTLRSTWAMLLLLVAVSAGLISLVGALSGTHGNPALRSDNLRDLLAVPAMLTCGVVLVLSIVSTAGEYRTGAINGSLLVTPQRERFIAAKFAAAALLGVAMTVSAAVTAYGAAVAFVAARDLPVDLATTDAALTVVGTSLAAALFGVAGAGLGALVRNQTVAVVAALVWWFVIESVLPDLLQQPELAKYLPIAAAGTLVHAGSPTAGAVGPGMGALLLVGYVAAIALAGTAMLRRRDVN